MKFVFAFLFLLLPVAAGAVEAPNAQVHINAAQILRGHFVAVHQQANAAPLQTMGHVVVAPAYGLIWGIEQPFPTATIVTPNGVAQDIGGMAMKLPAKNIAHLYEMVGGALAGDWSGLAEDYMIAESGTGNHWQMILTPRADAAHKTSYQSITVSGRQFVENIVMVQMNGTQDAFTFSDEVLSPVPPTPKEAKMFAIAGR